MLLIYVQFLSLFNNYSYNIRLVANSKLFIIDRIDSKLFCNSHVDYLKGKFVHFTKYFTCSFSISLPKIKSTAHYYCLFSSDTDINLELFFVRHF